MDALYSEIEPYDQGMLDVGDGNLVYWELCGNRAGKPAVMFHGGPGSGCVPDGGGSSTRPRIGSFYSTSAAAGGARLTLAIRRSTSQ